MGGHVLQIQRKTRERSNSIVNLQDFDWTEAAAIDASTVLNNPNASLYCLDLDNKRFIFVETPPDQDLSAAPFYYQAQYELAQRLFAIPFKDFSPLTKTLETIIKQQLVFIYSVGRCGSTLLSRIFAQADGVLSLSEPDVFSQLVALRNRDRSRDPEIAKLLKLCVGLICKPTAQDRRTSANSATCVIKFRSYGIELADLLHEVFPKAKAIFLYRNARSVVKSSIQAYSELAKGRYIIQKNIDTYSLLIPLLKEYADRIDFDDPNATDLYTTMWLSVMQRYVQLHTQKIPMVVLRYEDLVDQPELTIEAVFQYCRLEANLAKALQVMSHDSQQGSNLSQANTADQSLDDSQLDRKINRLLSYHSTIQSPDFTPPVGH